MVFNYDTGVGQMSHIKFKCIGKIEEKIRNENLPHTTQHYNRGT
jgi:hypothetical protein